MATIIDGVKVTKSGYVNIGIMLNPKYYFPLLEKCKEVDAIAKAGRTAGEPSVGALLRLIATGEVKLTRQ